MFRVTTPFSTINHAYGIGDSVSSDDNDTVANDDHLLQFVVRDTPLEAPKLQPN